MAKADGITKKMISLMLSFVFFAGCSYHPEAGKINLPEITPTEAPTLTQTATFVSSPEITQTAVITPSVTPTIHPSLTPLPTRNVVDAEKDMAKLLAANTNCSQACFFGIIPGETNFQVMKQYLQQFPYPQGGYQDDTKSAYSFGPKIKGDTIDIDANFINENDWVDSLVVSVSGLYTPKVERNDWAYFTPDSMMRTFGVPTQIIVNMGEGPEGSIGYVMTFLFDEQHMYVKYISDEGNILPQSVIHTCPLKNRKMNSFDIGMGNYDPSARTYGIDLALFTSLSTQDMYDILVNGKQNHCFDLDYKSFVKFDQR